MEAFNANGALCARVIVSQRVPEGMMMMYHAQEKIVNVPGSEIMNTRGGDGGIIDNHALWCG